jgi:uncharacterized membrane protein
VTGDKRFRRLVDGLAVFSIGLGTTQIARPDLVNRLVGATDDGRSRAVQRWLGGAREVGVGLGIESRRRPELWLWSRVAGDVVDLSMLGAVLAGPGRPMPARRRAAAAIAAVLGVTAADVLAAVRLTRASDAPEADPLAVEAAARITVAHPIGEVYTRWHELDSMAEFLTHVRTVRRLSNGQWHWEVDGPLGSTIEWDAEVYQDRANELIAWRSVGSAAVRNAGTVEFHRAPGGRGTEIRVRLRYEPPGGALGVAVATLLGDEPNIALRDDLRRFKQVLETGEVVRSEASVLGADARSLRAQRPAQPLPAF